MLKCSPEAFAKCPTRHLCGERHDDATFAEGSDCDKFNQDVLASPKTNADRIRAMSDEELAKNLYRFCDLEERVGYCKNLSECEKLLDTEDGIPEQRCICCLLEWLQQPAEVEK